MIVVDEEERGSGEDMLYASRRSGSSAGGGSRRRVGRGGVLVREVGDDELHDSDASRVDGAEADVSVDDAAVDAGARQFVLRVERVGEVVVDREEGPLTAAIDVADEARHQ
jgi:hypothetical protein